MSSPQTASTEAGRPDARDRGLARERATPSSESRATTTRSSPSATITDAERGLAPPAAESDRSSAAPAPKFANNLSLAHVWSTHVGIFKLAPASGWTHVLNKIGHFDGLLTALAREKLHGRVARLVLVAHGGEHGGRMIMGNPQNPADEVTYLNIAKYQAAITRLGDFLVPDGKFILMSCAAGAGKEGTVLLTAISHYLPGRTIVGFSIKGVFGPSCVKSECIVGDMVEGPQLMSHTDIKLIKGLPRMTEDSSWAKWVKDGKVIRQHPYEEIGFFRGNWDVTAAISESKSVKAYAASLADTTLDALTLSRSGKTVLAATIDKLDLFPKPKIIDLTYTSGKERGKKSAGIFSFGDADWNTLSLCLAAPGDPRPTEFAADKGSDRLLLTLKRRPAPPPPKR